MRHNVKGHKYTQLKIRRYLAKRDRYNAYVLSCPFCSEHRSCNGLFMTSPWTWGGLPTRTPVRGSTHLQNRPCWQIPVCYGAAFSLLGEGCGWQECLLSTASGWHGAMSSSKAVCGQFGYCSMGLRPGAHGCGAYAVIIIFWLRLKLTEPKLL